MHSDRILLRIKSLVEEYIWSKKEIDKSFFFIFLTFLSTLHKANFRNKQTTKKAGTLTRENPFPASVLFYFNALDLTESAEDSARGGLFIGSNLEVILLAGFKPRLFKAES